MLGSDCRGPTLSLLSALSSLQVVVVGLCLPTSYTLFFFIPTGGSRNLSKLCTIRPCFRGGMVGWWADTEVLRKQAARS